MIDISECVLKTSQIDHDSKLIAAHGKLSGLFQYIPSNNYTENLISMQFSMVFCVMNRLKMTKTCLCNPDEWVIPLQSIESIDYFKLFIEKAYKTQLTAFFRGGGG